MAAVGTGKTLFLLLKIWKFCEDYPDTLALVVRKEYTDLRDSTLKDFQRYFNVTVDGNKEYHFANGSVIMFRHGDEIDVLKNLNLTIFGNEQSEESESEETFTFLRDRLRRTNAPIRQGCIIGNTNGDNWIKRLWKDKGLQEAELYEATTFDNADNLPADFIADLRRMEDESPEHYQRYVMNDWFVTDDQFILIKPERLEKLKEKKVYPQYTRRIVACDPSQGGDECVLYAIENNKITESKYLHINDTMVIAGEIATMMYQNNTQVAAVDSIGVGAGIYDRLRELGKEVIGISSAEKAFQENRFYNRRTEIWWYVFEQVRDGLLAYPEDPELRRQLCSVRYKVINSNGKIQLEPKQDTKDRLTRSPDRADAFVYGIWAIKDTPPITKDAWKETEHREILGTVKSAMGA